MTNKRGPPDEDKALRLDGRACMVYWGDAKHEQASSLTHERVAPPSEGPKEKKLFDSDEAPQWTLTGAKRGKRFDGSLLNA